jgi:hypothetical protein
VSGVPFPQKAAQQIAVAELLPPRFSSISYQRSWRTMGLTVLARNRLSSGRWAAKEKLCESNRIAESDFKNLTVGQNWFSLAELILSP